MRGQPRYNIRPHACLPPSLLAINAWMTSQLTVALNHKATWVIDAYGLFLTFPVGACTTWPWQTSGGLVQELNVCTVQDTTFWSDLILMALFTSSWELIVSIDFLSQVSYIGTCFHVFPIAKWCILLRNDWLSFILANYISFSWTLWTWDTLCKGLPNTRLV